MRRPNYVIFFFSCFLLVSLTVHSQRLPHKAQPLLNKAKASLDTNLDSVIYFSEKAYLIAQEEKDNWALSKSLTYKARALEQSGKPGQAIIDYFEGLYWTSLSDTTDFYNSYVITRNIAAIQMENKNYREALTYYDSALFYLNKHLKTYPEIAKQYADHLQLYETKYFQAIGYRRSGELIIAQKNLYKLYSGNETPVSFKSLAYNQMGVLFNEINEYDSALKYINEGLALKEADSTSRGHALHNSAVVYFRQQNFTKAAELYQQAIKVKANLNNPQSLYISWLDLGETYLKMNRYDESIAALTKALTVLDSNVVNSNLKYFVAYEFLSKNYMNTDTEKAMFWLNKYSECVKSHIEMQQKLRDENAQNALNQKLKNFQSNFEQEKEIQWLETKYVAIGFVVVMLVGLITFFGYRSISIKRKKRLWKSALGVLNK